MANNIQYTCLIPFFNEGNRILDTLLIATKAHSFAHIICVDDGSTDNMSETIISQFPQVELISLSQNKGKSYAIFSGLEASHTSHVFLLDADLKGLTPEELDLAITRYEEHHLDMLILGRKDSNLFVRLNRGDVLFSGQRIMKATDLHTIFLKQPSDYQLEIAINMFMRQHKKSVAWMTSAILNTYKSHKWGFIQGVKQEIAMAWDLVHYAGIREYVVQILTFSKQQV
ncbi:MAG: glycosyl transferase [Candidatus Magasanikbacteria bacterium CG_4_9_14_0_2_um_filter_41_10]|uniref:Glycosyl transferase n=1 Tax=Candidatus Magasanikbacteria bacterium CG_4_10_14_0_2_um_filter_41_31 TaxID=1974639 RepID=A0A2M7V1Y4_9BACT|nr:MAG: hypothetical protein AUJ37_03650 [Candidatus Magasanikbacteria bacterium CG1_02_41_34]PIZ92403.1 MAG: glycosyl transferase [Candidatus Magasanikbacteria bacterium CG_4_10_14_0_2_um_filter_41_31]PJC53254.1 MAG: glycosyl transferase [Candidatus Magasanikbacteria bacterium CG_4_9_14_0_2_um_filter_41_10]